ncbi:MAG TPA: methyltransferase domain-containing protein [Verrucomicrobiae bacterium]
MLHKKRVAQTVYYALKRRVRRTLGFRPRHTAAPVLGCAFEEVIARHGWIVRTIVEHGPKELDLRGKAACEVGAGDCLAGASCLLSKGARHVNIVEVEPPVVNERQVEVLNALKKQGLPVDPSIVQRNGDWHLDSSRVAYYTCFMEKFEPREEHEFLFSFSVMEHVEDLHAFYTNCHRVLAPGGWMLHQIDLGGHALFEDPMPPLDFQTYPDWLFRLMYPKYHRATRRFVDEHVEAVKRAGFKVTKVTPTRKADENYLRGLWPNLRSAARKRPFEDVQVVEFALLARKE